MIEIKEEEIVKRLQTLQYQADKEYQDWSTTDKYLVQYSIKKGMRSISSNLNRSIDDFVEEMRENVIDIICSEFLNSKRNIGINEDGSITPPTGDVKSIKEDTLSIEYATDSSSSGSSSNISPFDEMIDYLKKEAYQNLQSYRYFYRRR